MSFNRRDFLKVGGITAAAGSLPFIGRAVPRAGAIRDINGARRRHGTRRSTNCLGRSRGLVRPGLWRDAEVPEGVPCRSPLRCRCSPT
jgi:hypothetical protein